MGLTWTLFFSIGIVEWSQFDLVFRTLDWKDNKMNALGHLIVNALNIATELLDFISLLPLHHNIALRFYRLHGGRRGVTLDGRTLELEAVSDGIDSTTWCPA